jgi:hypothetical protein
MSFDLLAQYCAGGVIQAGTALEPPPDWRPWVDGSKVARRCRERGCGSILYGWTDQEAAARLAAHQERFHGE